MSGPRPRLGVERSIDELGDEVLRCVENILVGSESTEIDSTKVLELAHGKETNTGIGGVHADR